MLLLLITNGNILPGGRVIKCAKSNLPVDARALVVTAQQKEVLRVLDLVCKSETNGLE